MFALFEGYAIMRTWKFAGECLSGTGTNREKGAGKAMKVKELEQYIAIDVESSIARFAGMETMYVKYLKKLPEDKTFEELKAAVEAEDQKEIEIKAHTLKGICGNLGLTGLYQKSDALVKAVREGRPEEIGALYTEIKDLMEETVPVLRELE